MSFENVYNKICDKIDYFAEIPFFHLQLLTQPENLERLEMLSDVNDSNRAIYNKITSALEKVDVIAERLQNCYSFDDLQYEFKDMKSNFKYTDKVVSFNFENVDGYIYEGKDGILYLGDKINIYDPEECYYISHGFDLRKCCELEKVRELKQKNDLEI